MNAASSFLGPARPTGAGVSRSSVFREVASAIGLESARKLIECFGGTELFVPQTITARHKIAKAIGIESARMLSTYFHGTELSLPVSWARRREVEKLAGDPEMTKQKIAIATGYSERQVYRILGEEDDDRQGNLFSDGSAR